MVKPIPDRAPILLRSFIRLVNITGYKLYSRLLDPESRRRCNACLVGRRDGIDLILEG